MQNTVGLPGITALRAGYAAGTLTPGDVAEDVLRRIAAAGDDHVWITLVPAADLRARAAGLAARARSGEALPPLYGIPFAVKDNIDVAGLPTTVACPDFAYVPAVTATAVQRLLDAGAMLVGKTNLDQFATGLTGVRSPYGACESVFGGGLVSGGSSSGSGVAVAAGLVTFALGTDTAGSGRVPAALNGIVGIKPTRGLVPTDGVVPACRSLDCVSVFARDVEDGRAVLDVIAGPTGADPWSRTAPAPAPVPAVPRVGVPAAAQLEFFGDDGQRERFAAAAGRLGAAGVTVLPVGDDLLALLREAGDLLYGGPWVAERLAGLGSFLAERPDSVLPVIREVVGAGERFSAVDAFEAAHRLREIAALVDRLWEYVDALVLPTVGTTFTIEEVERDPLTRNLALGRYTQFTNLLDLAAVTVPHGTTTAGRPASLTLVGPAWSDALLARIAETLPAPADETLLAVVGKHLAGESRNHELTERGGTLAEVTRTADAYRLYRLPGADGGLPGLVRTPGAGTAIEVEVWRLPTAAVGGLLAAVAAPLSFGRVLLADGRSVLGFLCEAYAAAARGAEDISATGGWRAFRRAPVPASI